MDKRTRSIGVTMAEYTLIAFMICVGVLGALLMLSGSMDETFRHIAQSTGGDGYLAEVNPHEERRNALLDWISGRGSAVDRNSPQAIAAQLGANGTTRLLSGQMKHLLESMVASGELTPEQAQSLQELVGQSERLGEIQNRIEHLAAVSSGTDDFLGRQVQFDNRTQSSADLLGLLGAVNDDGSMSYGPEHARYQRLLDAALANGALNHTSEAGKTLRNLAQEVSVVSEQLSRAAQDDTAVASPRHLGQHMADFLVSRNSFALCGALCGATAPGGGETAVVP